MQYYRILIKIESINYKTLNKKKSINTTKIIKKSMEYCYGMIRVFIVDKDNNPSLFTTTDAKFDETFVNWKDRHIEEWELLMKDHNEKLASYIGNNNFSVALKCHQLSWPDLKKEKIIFRSVNTDMLIKAFIIKIWGSHRPYYEMKYGEIYLKNLGEYT